MTIDDFNKLKLREQLIALTFSDEEPETLVAAFDQLPDARKQKIRELYEVMGSLLSVYYRHDR